MLVIIKKDDATSVSREVADMDAARALLSGGLPVFLQHEDGSTTPVTAEDAPVEAQPDVDPPAEPVAEAPETPQAPSDEPVQG